MVIKQRERSSTIHPIDIVWHGSIPRTNRLANPAPSKQGLSTREVEFVYVSGFHHEAHLGVSRSPVPKNVGLW